MKAIYYLISAIILACLVMIGLHFFYPQKNIITTTNLIPNASVEASAKRKPLSWQNGTWGTQKAQFKYSSNAQNKHKSLYVKVTDYKNGDAKWYFEPIDALSYTYYAYSDYYKSTADTSVVAQITDTSNNTSFINLGETPKSNDWKLTYYTFITPINTKSVTVFHLMNSNGELYTDNFSLEKISNDNPENVLHNSSVEITDEDSPTIPALWNEKKLGSNETQFSYNEDSHTGKHAVAVETTAYTDGSAGWSFDPLYLTPGKQYEFSDYYKSSIPSTIQVMVTKNNDQEEIIPLNPAPVATDWTLYSHSFTVPTDAKAITIMHGIAGIGVLVSDDFNVRPMISGFSRALVTVSFDDSWQSIYKNAFPIMQKYKLCSTQYTLTGVLGRFPYMNNREVKTMKEACHQIASHTVTHPDLTTLPPLQLNQELAKSKQSISNSFKVTPWDFASPFGTYNAQTVTEIKKQYRSHRSTDIGYNSPDGFDIYNLKVQNITSQTTPEEFQSWLDRAAHDKTWLILVYHQIEPTARLYNTTPDVFESQMQAIVTKDIPVITVDQALSEVLPQVSK